MGGTINVGAPLYRPACFAPHGAVRISPASRPRPPECPPQLVLHQRLREETDHSGPLGVRGQTSDRARQTPRTMTPPPPHACTCPRHSERPTWDRRPWATAPQSSTVTTRRSNCSTKLGA